MAIQQRPIPSKTGGKTEHHKRLSIVDRKQKKGTVDGVGASDLSTNKKRGDNGRLRFEINGHVYVAVSGRGNYVRYRIGFSRHVEQRVRKSCFGMKIIAVIPASRRHERNIHLLLREYAVQHGWPSLYRDHKTVRELVDKLRSPRFAWDECAELVAMNKCYCPHCDRILPEYVGQ